MDLDGISNDRLKSASGISMRTMLYVLSFGLLTGLSAAPAKANQWVGGQVETLEEYGSYGNGFHSVLITLSSAQWFGGTTSDGPTNCTGRFRVAIGAEGVTEEVKDRIFAMMLSAYVSDKPVRLYVETTGSNGYCAVQAARIG